MILVCKQIVTETAHRLMDYEGKCARIHGHSYRWEVEVEAPVQTNGISMDFADLKCLLRDHIQLPFDHMLVLCERDPTIPLLEIADVDLGIYSVPYNPTAENMARAVATKLVSFLPKDHNLVSVTCWETENSYAKFVR